MRKFIAIGDVHADFDTMWAALRAASCADAQGRPTPPVQSGFFQVVLIGDLVHPKNEREYARVIGLPRFTPGDPDHLLLAAMEQVRQLEKLRAYQQQAPHAVHILLGNHDDAVLHPRFVLGTSTGLRHVEFDPAHGGAPLPDNLHEWMSTFLRELRIGTDGGDLHFAHVSPLPAHTHYDDLFYADQSSKRWFVDAPDYVRMAGLQYGVYGHTQIQGGILLEPEHRFAMIDALQSREYLELMFDPADPEPIRSVRAVPF